MLKKFRTKELVVCALFGALAFVLSLVLGGIIIMATGIPGTGGIVNLLIIGFLGILCAKIIDKFGAMTLTMTIFSTLAIPTIILSPPGIHKIAIGILWGISWDFLYFGLKKYNALGNMIASGLAAFVAGMGIYYAVILLGLPGVEQMRAVAVPFLLAAMIGAAVGSYIGTVAYEKKLKNKAFIRQMQD